MALPSPCFVQNTFKPVSTEKTCEKTHVTRDEVKQPNHFIAYCKVCREGFSSENLLFQHRKTHERCPYDDCKFNANGKVIAEHVQRVHMKANTLVKIQDLTTPEQIEKWREERRKRYPTTANVLLRQQAKEARAERGEKLQDRHQRFGDSKQRNHIKNFDNNRNHPKDFRNDRGNGNKRYQQSNKRDRHWKTRNDHQDKQPNEQQKDSKDEVISQVTVADSSAQAPTVSPTTCGKTVTVVPSVAQQHNDDSSDDEVTATPRFKGTSMMKDYHEVKTIVQEKAALSILGMYGSDSESEVEAKKDKELDEPEASETEEFEAVERVENNDIKQEGVEDVAMSEDEQDLEAPDEVPIQHNIEGTSGEPSTPTSPEKLSRKRRQDNQQSQRFVRPKTRSGLDYSKLRTMSSVNPFLEKLLQQDIRHERNVLLQCVNYVVRNSFFDAALKHPEALATSGGTTTHAQETVPESVITVIEDAPAEGEKIETSDLVENTKSF